MSIKRREFLKNSFVLTSGLILPQYLVGCSGEPQNQEYDIVVYGATSAGVVAAVAAARKGRSVILLEPSGHLGGLTTGGLGQTDIGIEGTIGGMSLEFYSKIREYYQNDDAWQYQTWDEFMKRTDRLQEGSEGMFAFEPHVARQVYQNMLDEAGVPVVMNEQIILGERGVDMNNDRITAIETESGNVYRGQIFIDATYEADLMAMAGVSYTVGREANAKYDETLNGVQKRRAHNHVFKEQVDPYVTPGEPGSGVLPGVHDGDPGEDGEGDDRVQAYCFRLTLTDVPENQVPIEKPAGYDEQRYELLFRNFESGDHRLPWINSPMPDRKTDINNKFAFSTDNIGMNYDYPDGDYVTRSAIIDEHRNYQQGLVWALGNHPRVPEEIRNEVGKWGLAANEFEDNGNWTPQLYIRESRRMLGEYVMTEHDCRRLEVVDDPVGLGSYNMDSHNVQRYVTEEEYAQNEGNIEYTPGGPYAISYRSLIPRSGECSNLLVCCNGVSASHISFGSIRMEPVFMVLAQSAANAADIALAMNSAVQDVPYQKLRERLLNEGQKLDIDLNEWPPADGPTDELCQADCGGL
ncbi:FAD-dependent oxidoreductase [Aliifodinibius sp. S!AR15-10]|uniref:FAD-dependent oxidoreductase n=1 Tax=Aliifodinibius sp. S!AR15-10 TaxID=2950437 RepID=UPI002855C658|nr:FAD-dependent oxidoreductase [Aliifodinibius sp. S!AR15-10]MDR8390373.1 FAD-dependent oxidoreductase [Aliifodinibius sp. S!AR15-10]